MFHRLFHRPIRAPQEGPASRLLVELLLAGGVALPAVDAWAQNVPARATTCRIASFGDGQTSGAPGFLRRSATWAAARSSRTAPYWPSGRSRCRPSARWCRQPRRTGTTWRPERRGPGLAGRQHRLSLECAGIGIRLRAGPEANATEVPAATEIRAIQNSEQLAMRTGVHLAGVEVLTGLRVELVKLGSDVLPGIGAFP